MSSHLSKVGSRLVVALVLALLGATGRAQGADLQAPPASDVELLDVFPHLFETLDDSWSDGVPDDVTDAEQSSEHYGLLLNAAMQPTTLSACIALAIQNNTSLQVQRLNPVAASAEVRRARAIFDPALFATVNRDRNTRPATTALTAGADPTLFAQNFTLNAGLRKTLLTGGNVAVQFNNNRGKFNPSLANPVVPLYTTSLTLSLNQPLLQNFGWRYALLMVDIAQTAEQAAYHQYVASLTNLVAQVERAYWLLVLATENVRVQEQGLSLANELLRQNEGKYKVGSLPQTAVLEARVDVANREALLIQARNSLEVTRDNLRAVINAKDPNATAIVMVDPADRPTVELYHIDLDRSLQAALAQRPELTAARYDLHAKGLQRKVAQNQLLPQVNLVGSIGVNGLAGTDQNITFNGQPVVNPTIRGGYDDALGLLPDGRFYSYGIGATVEVPLDNAQAKAAYAQSNITLSQSKLTLQQVQEAVTLEVKTAVSNLQSDLKSIEATRIARQLAEENVRNQKARYDVGLATTKDLLDYGDRLTRAQFAEVQALTAYNSDLAELRRVEGTLLSARNVVLESLKPEDAPWWASF